MGFAFVLPTISKIYLLFTFSKLTYGLKVRGFHNKTVHGKLSNLDTLCKSFRTWGWKATVHSSDLDVQVIIELIVSVFMVTEAPPVNTLGFSSELGRNILHICSDDKREFPLKQSFYSQSALKLCFQIINGDDVLTEVCLGPRVLEGHRHRRDHQGSPPASTAPGGPISITVCVPSTPPVGLHVMIPARGCQYQLQSHFLVCRAAASL